MFIFMLYHKNSAIVMKYAHELGGIPPDYLEDLEKRKLIQDNNRFLNGRREAYMEEFSLLPKAEQAIKQFFPEMMDNDRFKAFERFWDLYPAKLDGFNGKGFFTKTIDQMDAFRIWCEKVDKSEDQSVIDFLQDLIARDELTVGIRKFLDSRLWLSVTTKRKEGFVHNEL